MPPPRPTLTQPACTATPAAAVLSRLPASTGLAHKDAFKQAALNWSARGKAEAEAKGAASGAASGAALGAASGAAPSAVETEGNDVPSPKRVKAEVEEPKADGE